MRGRTHDESALASRAALGGRPRLAVSRGPAAVDLRDNRSRAGPEEPECGRAGRGMNRQGPDVWDPGHGAPTFQGDRGLFVLTAAQLRQHGLNIENLRAGVANVVRNAREEIDHAQNVARAAAHQAHVAGAHAQHADARAEVAENIAAQVLRQGGAEVRAMQSEVGVIREQAAQYQQAVQALAEAHQRVLGAH